MARITNLNAHEAPPESVRLRYKQYQKTSLSEIDADASIVDLQSLDPDDLPSSMTLVRKISTEELQPAFDRLATARGRTEEQLQRSIPVFTHKSVAGEHCTIRWPGPADTYRPSHGPVIVPTSSSNRSA